MRQLKEKGLTEMKSDIKNKPTKANKKVKKFIVTATASYTANVEVEAKSEREAEEKVEVMLENGEIDPVSFKGTMNLGGVSFYASSIGRSFV